MQRLVTIFVTFVFLLSGMHVTVATHYCGGKPAAIKLSLSGEKASCGMESDTSGVPSKTTLIKTNCCFDEVMVYQVESHYSYSLCSYNVPAQSAFHLPLIPAALFMHDYAYKQSKYTDLSPPGYYAVNSVNMAEICSFLI